jgi:ABC-type transport system substrate-binding protein
MATSHVTSKNGLKTRFDPIFSGDVFKTMYETEASPDPDTITVASTGDPLVLDPAACYDTASGQVLQNIYETLVFYDEH